MSKENDDSSESTLMLSALEKDLPLNECSNVSSALLHVFPSRKRPASLVQSLLPELTMEKLQKSHQALLQEDYLVKTDNDSSLDVMKRVAATVWFLQLLFECPSVLNDGSSQQQQQQVYKMALALLQHLIKTIQTLLQKQQNENEQIEEEQECIMDASTLNSSAVASFAVGALLRVIDPYVSSLPILLSPLWKGICTLISSVGPYLPNIVADSTLKALCRYLHEGTMQTMQAMHHYAETRTISPQFALQLKIVTFIVARCAVVLSNRRGSGVHSTTTTTDIVTEEEQKSSSNDVIAHVIELLLELRGLTLATRASLTKRYSCVTPQDEAFLSQHASLQQKVEQCLIDYFTTTNKSDDETTTASNPFDLQQLLLRLKPALSKRNHQTKELLHLASSSFYMAKALVLTRLLRHARKDVESGSDKTTSLHPQTIQSLLKMIQELLFSTLPHCGTTLLNTFPSQQHDFLSSTLVTMVSATRLCHFQGCVEIRSKLNRLLVTWLAPVAVDKDLHPVTREWVVFLVHFHVLSITTQLEDAQEDSRSDSPRSVDIQGDSDTISLASTAHSVKPLVSLLVKVLVDSRTFTKHRRNVASVVIRLLNSSTSCTTDNASSSVVCKKVRLLVQQTIATELDQVMKRLVQAQRRKRKRNKSSDTRHGNESASSFFTAEDVGVLVQVLKHVSGYTLPSLDGFLASLARDLMAAVDDSKSAKICSNYTLGNHSRNVISLLLALASGIMGKSTLPESFKSKTGMQVSDFVSSLITWLGRQQQHHGSRQSKTRGIRKSHAVVMVACLNFIETSFSLATMNINQLRALVNIAKEYCSVSCPVLALDSPPCSTDARQSAVSLLFAVAALLSGTTRVIPTSCPSDILQGIASTYKMLFETNAWPIVARAVTSLVRFASTIPSAHQGILPECIPTDSQGLLQCRLQGLVYRNADSHQESQSIAVNESYSKTLKPLIPVLKSKDSLFATTSNDRILEGSYVLTMPTEDGRSAQVIFAPGEESFSDIKYMLGAEDFSNVQVRRLEQVRLVGNGCRFLSKTLEL